MKKSGSLYVGAMGSGDLTTILNELERLNLDTVNVPVKIDIPDAASNNPSVNATGKSEAIYAIQVLQAAGYDIILEAYPWVAGGTITETAVNPADKATWFINWKSCLAELIDDIANVYSVYGLNVASNFVLIEGETARWVDVFGYVKNTKLYAGQVIYRTNWWVTATWDTGPGSTTEAYNNKLANTLFSDSNLDIISIACYFELTDTVNPTVEQVEAALRSTTRYGRGQDVYTEIKNFYDTHSKPIFFGELSFPSRDQACLEPWNPDVGSSYSEIAQANGFEAYKNTFFNKDWYHGFSYFIVGVPSSNYSAIDKLAESVISGFSGMTVIPYLDYMRLNNITIPVDRNSPGINYKKIGDTFEAHEGNIRSTVYKKKREYKFNTSYLTENEMLFLEKLIQGDCFLWTFNNEDLYSNKGIKASIIIGGSYVTEDNYVTGKFGYGIDLSGSGGLTLPIDLPDNYSIFLYRDPGGGSLSGFDHIAILSDGNVYVDGYEDAVYDVSWLTVNSNNIIIDAGANIIDEIFIVPAIATELFVYMLAIYEYQISSPYLRVKGDLVTNEGETEIICKGFIDDIKYIIDGGYIMSFSLKEQ